MKRLKTITATTMALAITLGGGLWASSARAADTAPDTTQTQQLQTDKTFGKRLERAQWSGTNGTANGTADKPIRKGHMRVKSDEIAALLGLTQDELGEAVKSGKTIAAIASEKGVDVQTVIDGIVAAQTEQLDQLLADGKLTQEQYDSRKAGLADFAAKLVNGEAGGKGRVHIKRFAPQNGDGAAAEASDSAVS
ncbi:hypothetical protein [Paenibacillus sp. GYB003]|uniref:hypothetical protein n=1 Tax=Paenibacillus sp. GYB003 TaxID=2994392 RepID=UPI002F96B158